MFYLHTSNRTEILLEQLAAVIEAGGRLSLLEKEIFLVQSQGMERLIAQRLASHFQSWCNYDFLLPLSFQQEIAARLGYVTSGEGFDRKNTVWKLEALLRDVNNEKYQFLHHYLSGRNKEVKRFQLARKLAQIFDEYQLMRSDLLAAWLRHELVSGDSVEEWQADLWCRLSMATGKDDKHRGEIFAELTERLRAGASPDLPRRVSVFGLHIMAPIFLEFLKALALHTDVHLYVLSPCKEYWGEIESKKSRMTRLKGLLAKEGELPKDDERELYHPLLAALGLQGRDFQKMLVENVDFHFEFAGYHNPADEKTSLLTRLQADILRGVQPERSSLPVDDSLRIISCHSPLRELAVLKDHILDLLYQDETLELRDIVVMAPDIQQYASFIPAVFHDIQHSIADRALRKRNSVMSAFLSYLQILAGDFGWRELLDLLRVKHVFPAFELTETDFDYIQKWLVEAGIRSGLGERGELFNENSWLQGLERLLMGFAVVSNEPVAGIYGYQDIEGSSGRILGGLCEFVALIRRASESYSSDKSLQEWAEILRTDVDRLFVGCDETDLRELHQLLTELMEAAEYHGEVVNFKVIAEWFTMTSAESRSSSGFLRGQLTFCSMLPMRSIPFQVVCLLGLNGDSFPRQDKHCSFDLQANFRRLGDRSPRVDDRYQFLEALVSARDCLYLSYVGRSIKNNEELPPSVVVGELLETLEYSYSIKKDDIVVEHPLHPFNMRYFSQDSGLFTYSESSGAVARGYVAGKKSEHNLGHWWGEDAVVELREIKEINFANLLSFYKNPQRWFVRNSLGINLQPGQSLPEESETFAVDALERFQVADDLIEAQLRGKASSDLLKLKTSRGRWMLGEPGVVKFAGFTTELEPFVDKIRRIDLGAELEPQSYELELGNYKLYGTLKRREKGLLMHRYSNLRGKFLFECWLHHLVLSAVSGDESETWGLAKDTVFRLKGRPAASHLLALIDHFVAGSEKLSHFHIETAFQYGKKLQVKSGRGKSPRDTAIKQLEDSAAAGREPELALVMGEAEEFFENGFEALYEELFAPLWEVYDEQC